MTSADAQAFKRACSCFGLGRYFYDFQAVWVDLDQNRQPARTPVLFAWALPENWRNGMRPSGRNGNGSAVVAPYGRNERTLSRVAPGGLASFISAVGGHDGATVTIPAR